VVLSSHQKIIRQNIDTKLCNTGQLLGKWNSRVNDVSCNSLEVAMVLMDVDACLVLMYAFKCLMFGALNNDNDGLNYYKLKND